MAEFITITPKVGPRISLNVERITRYYVNSAGDLATVCFDMNSIEIKDRESVLQFLAGVRDPKRQDIKNGMLNAIGELKLYKDEAPVHQTCGLNWAIDRLEKAVEAL